MNETPSPALVDGLRDADALAVLRETVMFVSRRHFPTDSLRRSIAHVEALVAERDALRDELQIVWQEPRYLCDFCGQRYSDHRHCCKSRREYLNQHGEYEKEIIGPTLIEKGIEALASLAANPQGATDERA